MENIHKHNKGEKHAYPHKMYGVFHLSVDWFLSYPLDDREQNVRPVKRWERQQIKHGKVR